VVLLSVQSSVQKGEKFMATKDRRREVRLTAHDENLIVEAAGLAGVSVTEFLLNQALPEAEHIVENHHTITVNQAAYAEFLAALDRPSSYPTELAEQVSKARRLKHVD
jgi:uncharacterized protein (DUF1778 family)